MADALGEALATVGAKKHGDFLSTDGVPTPTLEEIDTPDKATMWAEEQIRKATPRAIQEVIHQLRNGNMKERAVMAMQILDRAGVKAKEGPTMIAPVIVLTSDAVKDLPWAKKAAQLAKSKEDVVEGELVIDLKKGDAKKIG